MSGRDKNRNKNVDEEIQSKMNINCEEWANAKLTENVDK